MIVLTTKAPATTMKSMSATSIKPRRAAWIMSHTVHRRRLRLRLRLQGMERTIAALGRAAQWATDRVTDGRLLVSICQLLHG
jgi:hypothetical protein